LCLVALAAPGFAQDVVKKSAMLGEPVPTPEAAPFNLPAGGYSVMPLCNFDGNGSARPNGCLTGNHNFDRFVGFVSNPLQSIDPRAVTEFWPVFASTWVSPYGRAPSGDLQLYGAGLYVALSERLSVGLCQGGYAVADFARFRQGWLNLGGFGQYTLIQDVPNQFLLTTGLRWEAPSGEADVFQGHGPAHLAPYITVGKEFGKFHLLATTGYQFPARDARIATDLFYANFHFDRQTFGWLYPLVEFNCIYHTTAVDPNRPFLHDFFNFGTFETSGNLVTMAAGFTAVVVPNRVEFSAVYTTTLASQFAFDTNGLLVKMVLRY
jgi:hypothetical protein